MKRALYIAATVLCGVALLLLFINPVYIPHLMVGSAFTYLVSGLVD